MEDSTKRARTSHGFAKRAAALLVAGSLACGLVAGVAVAAGGSAAEEGASGATNVVAFHESMGTSFADLVKPITADMTPAEVAANTIGTREFCLSCHDWDAIVGSTLLPGDVTVYNKQGLYNVHDNHSGLVNCSDCHTVDEGETATLGCVGCHYMELPEGWEGFY